MSRQLGFGKRNITLFGILKRFHEKEIVVWENYREFAERIPEELRDRLGVDPEVGVSERGTIPKGKMYRSRLTDDMVTLYSPQVVDILKHELGRIRERFRSPFKPCCYYAECQFRRAQREPDRCSDPKVKKRMLREALEEEP